MLQALAGLAFWFGDLRLSAAGRVIGVAGLFSGWILRRRAVPRSWADLAVAPVAVWGALWWLGAGLYEVERLFRPIHRPHLDLLWLAASLAAFRWLGERLAWPGLSLAHRALLVVMVEFAVIESSGRWGTHFFAHLGWLAWPAAWLLWYHGLHRLERTGTPPHPRLHQVGLWLLLYLSAGELAWHVERLAGSGVWGLTVWGIVPMAALWLLGVKGAGRGWPFDAAPASYRRDGLVPVAVWLGGWILLTALVSPGSTQLPTCRCSIRWS